MSASSELWGPARVDEGGELVRALGALTIRIRRVQGEVWAHGTHTAGADPEPEDWTRWAIPTADALELRPSLPDRPVVVSPEQPFYLPPRGEARVFVRVPLFVDLVRVDGAGQEATLASHPSLVLSDTWWGTFTEGELAYWLTTRARRAVTNEVFEPHMVICPLKLSNASDQPLPVDRFAVRVAHLTLFGRDRAMWTDEVHVQYEGAQEGSKIDYTGREPDAAGRVDEIAAPREPPQRGLHARTFGRLRTLSGWS